jgi:hypothetical protein
LVLFGPPAAAVGLKSVNLQYNTLVRWANGTNDSSTAFHVHKILQNSLQKPFQSIFSKNYKNENKEV